MKCSPNDILARGAADIISEHSAPMRQDVANAFSSSVHERRECCFVLEGHSTYMLNGSVYEAHPGTLFLINHWIPHAQGYTPQDANLYHLWLYIEDNFINCCPIRVSNHGQYSLCAKSFRLGELYARLLNDRWNLLDTLQTPSANDAENYLKGPTNAILDEIRFQMAAADKPNAPDTLPIDAVIDNVRHYIQTTNARGCTLRHLEKISGYSRYYLAHAFKQHVGKTIGDFINDVRMDFTHAALDRGMRQKEIATELGFSSPSNFWNWLQRQKTTHQPIKRNTSMKLWQTSAPYACGDAPADIPEITPYLPPHANRPTPAILICPGGGYGCLCSTYEGHDIAAWLNEMGIAGFVLKYRIKPYKHPAPLTDAKRAMKTIRANAKQWNLDTDRIGVMGFSAGGHLAATLGTLYDNPAGDDETQDNIQLQTSRPDFMVLIYPVVTFVQPHASMGTQVNLIGENADDALRQLLSPQLHVTADTPQAFIAHSVKDQVVPVENSRMMVDALKRHGRPVEYLELPEGLHGLGCGEGEQWKAWQTACEAWLMKTIVPKD